MLLPAAVVQQNKQLDGADTVTSNQIKKENRNDEKQLTKTENVHGEQRAK